MEFQWADTMREIMRFPQNKTNIMIERIIQAAIITLLLHLLTLVNPPTRVRHKANSSSIIITPMASFFIDYLN